MTDETPFATRFGYKLAASLVREAAPAGFRSAVISAGRKDGQVSAFQLHHIIELVLGLESSGGFIPNPDAQSRKLTGEAEWWQVYEIAEAIYADAAKAAIFEHHFEYEKRLNEYCIRHDIGWRMVKGRWQVRFHEQETLLVDTLSAELESRKKATTANELRQAIGDLSRQPVPDLTGTVQHIGAAIECLARDVCGDPTLTLGDIIKRYPALFPGAYRKLAEAVWGITSNNGRHIHEGGEPNFNQVALLVGTVTALLTYLLDETRGADE